MFVGRASNRIEFFISYVFVHVGGPKMLNGLSFIILYKISFPHIFHEKIKIPKSPLCGKENEPIIYIWNHSFLYHI